MQSYDTLRSILDKIEYKDWTFHLDTRQDCYTVQIIFNAKCTVTGEVQQQHCRKWFISKYMTDNEIIRTVFMAVEKAEYHELCEKFKFNGSLINNPHMDVRMLAETELLTQLDKRETV